MTTAEWIAAGALASSVLMVAANIFIHWRSGTWHLDDKIDKATREFKEALAEHQKSDNAQFDAARDSTGELGHSLRTALALFTKEVAAEFKNYPHRDSFLRIVDELKENSNQMRNDFRDRQKGVTEWQVRMETKLDRLFQPRDDLHSTK